MAFTPTQPLLARAVRKLKLTTKMTNKGYYKGTRSSGIGHFSWHPKKWMIYQVDPKKVRTYVVPQGMEESNLYPFVGDRVKMPMGSKKKMTGKDYLHEIKMQTDGEVEAGEEGAY